MLLLTLGILAMGHAAHNGRVERMLTVATVATADSFGLIGVHAVISGLIGAPSPLQFSPVQLSLTLVGFVGLIALAARWLRDSWAASAACLLLLGLTLPGYFLTTFQIAPALVGYQSHDTTPFTETIVAASRIAAGIAMLVAAGMKQLFRRRAGAESIN
ncbi:hypothetical protein [Cryobacterium ruanii]|uniref:Uncharacterized protein n=1 Tax=Cryobacterium ruanii TaxID=1259197 RepID=A0A4R9ANC0_9MICO|nr:hypothetical protein [Cryobacterium ruanii]TFD65401.1 hypothetical protein E3T47_11320 [Cryobacterium ruanii]